MPRGRNNSYVERRKHRLRRSKRRKQIIQSITKWLNRILIIILSIVLISNMYIFSMRTFADEKMPKFMGYTTAIVISGSMSGYIEVNDMIIIHERNEYQVNDVVTFKDGEMIVTHRIIEETADGFITKGDANNTVDDRLLQEDNIIGKVVIIIPKIGLFIEYMRTPLGTMCIVLVGVLMILTSYFNRRDESETE